MLIGNNGNNVNNVALPARTYEPERGAIKGGIMIIETPEPGTRRIPAQEHEDKDCACCDYDAGSYINNAISGMNNKDTDAEWVIANALISIALSLEAISAETSAKHKEEQ
jgi:hypothetical protein